MTEHWEDGDYYEQESNTKPEEVDWDYLYEEWKENKEITFKGDF